MSNSAVEFRQLLAAAHQLFDEETNLMIFLMFTYKLWYMALRGYNQVFVVMLNTQCAYIARCYM